MWNDQYIARHIAKGGTVRLNGMKVLDALWFNNIGVVVGENPTGERKAYIGVGGGQSEVFDVQQILTCGTPVYPQALERILDLLGQSDKVGGTD